VDDLSRSTGKQTCPLEGARKQSPPGAESAHLGEPGLWRRIIRRRSLESVFLFVTSRCNSACRTCFYTRDDAPAADDPLGLDIIRRLAETSPRFDKLWISGGEPFLREDLAEIIALFHRRCGVGLVNLPTNGLLAEPVEAVVERLVRDCPALSVHLNFSLDGMGAAHDAIRGVPGAFEKTLSTMRRIQQRFGSQPHVYLNAVTVVTRGGDSYADLAEYLLARFRLATHFFEPLRGRPRDPGVQPPTRDELERLHRRLWPLYGDMARRLHESGVVPFGGLTLTRIYFIGLLRLLYGLHERNLDRPHPWGMSCTAGRTTIVIDHDGAFRACEMRNPVGRLQDVDWDLGAAFASRAMREETAAIGGGRAANCWCTHTCWMVSSMKFSPLTMLVRLPLAYGAGALRLAPAADRAPRLDPGAIERRYGLRPWT